MSNITLLAFFRWCDHNAADHALHTYLLTKHPIQPMIQCLTIECQVMSTSVSVTHWNDRNHFSETDKEKGSLNRRSCSPDEMWCAVAELLMWVVMSCDVVTGGFIEQGGTMSPRLADLYIERSWRTEHSSQSGSNNCPLFFFCAGKVIWSDFLKCTKTFRQPRGSVPDPTARLPRPTAGSYETRCLSSKNPTRKGTWLEYSVYISPTKTERNWTTENGFATRGSRMGPGGGRVSSSFLPDPSFDCLRSWLSCCVSSCELRLVPQCKLFLSCSFGRSTVDTLQGLLPLRPL